MNEIIQALIGPVALAVAALAACGYIFTLIRRECAGSEATVATLATSHPLLTGGLTLLCFLATVLIILRLGVLS